MKKLTVTTFLILFLCLFGCMKENNEPVKVEENTSYRVIVTNRMGSDYGVWNLNRNKSNSNPILLVHFDHSWRDSIKIRFIQPEGQIVAFYAKSFNSDYTNERTIIKLYIRVGSRDSLIRSDSAVGCYNKAFVYYDPKNSGNRLKKVTYAL